MSLARVFVEAEFQKGEFLPLPEEELHHLKVRRIKSGEKVYALNGKGAEAFCTFTGNGILVEDVHYPNNRELPVKVCLFQCMLKADKMELVIQKTTELGVYRIIPVISTRSVVLPKKNKLLRWRRIAAEAIKQCGRVVLPEIAEPTPIERVDFDGAKIFFWEEGGIPFSRVIKGLLPQNIAFLIGPEGGFSEEEAENLIKKGWKPVSLGPVILRSETASVFALSVVKFLCTY